MGSFGDTPKGRVQAAERAYANGEINWNEARRRIKAEGYTPASSQETKNKYKKKK